MYGKVALGNIFMISEIYTAFCHRYGKNYSYVGEVHDFWEIVIVVDGEIGVAAGRDVLILKSGQAILHSPMEFHNIWSSGGSSPEIVVLTFGSFNVPKLNSRIFRLSNSALKEAKAIIKSIYNTFTKSGVSVTGIINSEMLDYQILTKRMELFLLNVFSENVSQVQHAKSQSAKNYSTIINVLEKNIDKNLSIAQLAEMCNMSEINLKKTFSKYAGMGVKCYFNRFKMNQAVTMLRSGMAVIEVATALGYTDQNYFSSAFKRIIGHSPSYYKFSK